METTYYFVLGMLSVITLIFVGVMAWGLLKINKQQTHLLNIEEDIENVRKIIGDEMNYTKSRMEVERSDINRQFEDTYRRMAELDREQLTLISHTEENSNKYTDRRIDKMIDTYLNDNSGEVVNGLKSIRLKKKNLLKG